MKIESARFLTSASDLASCPPTRLPEVAFIGRSNVGKSSLVNMLTQQKDLAKVSKTPGKTKLINFFSMDGWWHLVDLPGYGFAKVAKGEQHRFNVSVADYLMGRENLKQVFVLVDSRFEPIELDLEFLAWLQDCPAAHALVFTKTDEVSGEKWRRNMDIYDETLRVLELRVPPMIPCSSKDRAGRGELLSYIESVLPKKPKRGTKSGISIGWMK